MSSWDVLQRPRWLLGGLIALVAALSFIRLGVWQLDRLDQRRMSNEVHTAALAAPPLRLATRSDMAGVGEYQAVTAAGTFHPGDTVMWVGRSFRGGPGTEILTPLTLDDGSLLLVDRGWIPLDAAVVAPPQGRVVVDGWIRTGATSGRVGAPDPDAGFLTTIRPDLDALGEALSVDLGDRFVVASALAPADTADIRLVDPPDFGEGNHLSYAIQWFLFAVVVAVGFPALLRHNTRHG